MSKVNALNPGNVGAQVRLVTDRLVLREVEEADLKAMHAYWSTFEVTRFMPRGALTEEATRKLVKMAISGREAHPRRYFRLAITLKEGGSLIGDCVCRVGDPENLEDLSRIFGQVYIGFFLDKNQWGKGYATEVARALIAFGFDQLHLRRLFAWCDTENAASIRVLEKVGMKREAHFRKSVLTQGEWRDCYVYGLLQDEWMPSKS